MSASKQKIKLDRTSDDKGHLLRQKQNETGGKTQSTTSWSRTITTRGEPPLHKKKASLIVDNVIEVLGAKEHNLKNVNVAIPKNKLVIVTGVSGSGKSSFAFDTLYAEGQRKYVESLSPYARQFLGQMEKPKYDSIRGLSPTIAIEQKSASHNPRSTVGTVTEIHDYLRVFYARFGEQYCHICSRKVGAQTPGEIVKLIEDLEPQSRVQIFAPLVKERKGEHGPIFQGLLAQGLTRVRVNQHLIDLSDGVPKLDKKLKHRIEVIVDRLVIGQSDTARIRDSVEQALTFGEGRLLLQISAKNLDEERMYSVHHACEHCGVSFEELSPQSFSFNSPLGACQECNGLGIKPEMDPEQLVVSPEKSLRDGAIEIWGNALSKGTGWTADQVFWLVKKLDISLEIPWKELPQKKQDALMWGDKKVSWEGLAPQLMRRYLATESESQKEYYRKYLSDKCCTSCLGARLKKESRAVKIEGMSLPDLESKTIFDAARWFSELKLTEPKEGLSSELRKEIQTRLGFLLDVGLNYLTLSRGSSTLSGGESQRIRLASQIGSELTGVIYVLDEPSIGLHQKDNDRLLRTLKRLRDLGNSVVVVEHDEDTIRQADFVCDFGPGAGELGGRLLAAGRPDEIMESKESITADFLSGRRKIPVPKTRRKGNGKSLQVIGAREHNLQNVTAQFPLGTLIAVTGVSGAGKSTLVNRIVLPALHKYLYHAHVSVGIHDAIKGIEHIDKMIAINQQPIGRTPRSNPATYTKLLDPIRNIFSETKEAKSFGYTAGRFSFNVKEGSCDVCGGDGQIRVEMHFLPDVFVTCSVCKGARYNDATLRVKYKNKNIADVLSMSVREAGELFSAHKDMTRILKTLEDVGLSYMKLGQPSPTLSGGEAQRIKLSKELAKVGTGRTLYILDEPTTGLHFEDVERLISVLQRLVDAGNTVVVIEHHLDLIKCADYIIDMGPDGGAGGGKIIASGTPEEVAKIDASYTGNWLRQILKLG